MDEVAAELEEKDAHDQELEEKLKAKLEEKAAELRAAKLQKKALEEEVEKEEEEEVPEPLDLSNVYVDKVLATGGPLRNGTEPVFDEAHADELMLSFIALRWTSLEYENDYPVYVEVKTSTEMKKDAKGVAKKKQQAPEPKIMFRLRKHKMAGAVQDPVILTSRIPLLTLVLGTYEEVAKDLHADLMDGVGIAAVIMDVPWGDEKDTGYNTAVDWGAEMQAIGTVFDLNAALPEEIKKQDLGKADGEAIVFAMGDITALNSINHEASTNRLKGSCRCWTVYGKTEVRGNTPTASGHLYTTLARSLNKPKLDYRKAVLAKFGTEFENVAGVQTLPKFFCGSVLGPLSITEYQAL
eukprot:gene7834-9303_t